MKAGGLKWIKRVCYRAERTLQVYLEHLGWLKDKIIYPSFRKKYCKTYKKKSLLIV